MPASSQCSPPSVVSRQAAEQNPSLLCFYVPKSFGERIFLLAVSEDSVRVHRGERTGLPVAFSRMSDALRLCCVRNGGVEATCCVLHTTEVELRLIKAAEELNEEIDCRMHRVEHGKKRKRKNFYI